MSSRSTRPLLITLLALVAGALLFSVPASARTSPIRTAGAHQRTADHAMVKRAKAARKCRARHSRAHCRAQLRKLQAAGRRLARSERRLRRLARTAASKRHAPALTAAGATLRWIDVPGVSSYVVARKAPHQIEQYSVVRATDTRPASAPGATVSFRVRASVAGAAWSNTVTVAYPAPPAAAPVPDRRAAPSLSVDGTTLRWQAVAGVRDYILRSRVPGAPDRYAAVSGTATTPAAVPGKTVSYALRTAVAGSAWSASRSIAYPAPDPTPAPEPAAGLQTGVVSGHAALWELPFITQVGAKHARIEFPIGTPVAQIAPVMDAFDAAGVQPLLLAGFQGRTPTVDEARNVASWARAFGPGGTQRAGKGYADATAVTRIEFGNETSMSYQYAALAGNSNWALTATYKDIAREYALRFKDAQEAVAAANPAVGLLAVGDLPGRWTTWTDVLFATVPDIGTRAAGWTVHPYGPSSRWTNSIDFPIQQLAAHGVKDPALYVTEYGIASDDGRCLDDNYGWDKCMTYAQAGTALTGALDTMRERYAGRIKAVFLYQAHDQKARAASGSREGYFGAVALDRSAKGAYTTAFKALLARG